jgi:hypothetical protein
MDKIPIKIYLICGLLIITILIYKVFLLEKKIAIEGMSSISGIDSEALQNIASIYNTGILKIKDIEVSGTITTNNLTAKSADFTNTLAANVTNIRGKLTANVANISDLATHNIETSENIKCKGNIVGWDNIHLVSKSTNKSYFINVDEKGQLQFSTPINNPILTLPNSDKGTPTFRASGLMYTNKNHKLGNSLDGDYYKNYWPKIFKSMQDDPGVKSNLIYLGGLDNHGSGQYRTVAGVRMEGGKFRAMSPITHGHGAICKTACNPSSSWDRSDIA